MWPIFSLPALSSFVDVWEISSIPCEKQASEKYWEIQVRILLLRYTCKRTSTHTSIYPRQKSTLPLRLLRRKLSSPVTRLYHTRVEHTGHLLSCLKCRKPFTSKASWNQHMLGHKRMKRIICDICGRTFVRLSNLRRHKLDEHSTYCEYLGGARSTCCPAQDGRGKNEVHLSDDEFGANPSSEKRKRTLTMLHLCICHDCGAGEDDYNVSSFLYALVDYIFNKVSLIYNTDWFRPLRKTEEIFILLLLKLRNTRDYSSLNYCKII